MSNRSSEQRHRRPRDRDHDARHTSRSSRSYRNQSRQSSYSRSRTPPKRPRYDNNDRRQHRGRNNERRDEVVDITQSPVRPHPPPVAVFAPEHAADDDDIMKLTDDEAYENEVMKQMEQLENEQLSAQQEEDVIKQRRQRLFGGLDDSVPVEKASPARSPLRQKPVSNVDHEEKKPLIDDAIPEIKMTNEIGQSEQAKPLFFGDDIFDAAQIDEDEDLFSTAIQPAVAAASSIANIEEVADADGYYHFRLGDLLAGRYEVFANQGRGVFSTVLRVRDRLGGNKELVLKVIRRNDVMYKAGLKEIEILNHLSEKDPENKKHVVRLHAHFEHRNHLCLVFEPMHMNLRELLKKFGGEGVSIEGVQLFAKHLFIALKYLKRFGIVHADLKPDNILVNQKMNLVKICDFGSALKIEQCEPTPVLVSRFYRAPEIMLGFQYGFPIDVWSVGCVLYELYTGKILFEGADNNDMLRVQMELQGPFHRKMLKKSVFATEHFDENFTFQRARVDPVTGNEVKEQYPIRIRRTMLEELKKSAGVLDQEQFKVLRQLAALISRCVELDPAKRITPEEALMHNFVANSN